MVNASFPVFSVLKYAGACGSRGIKATKPSKPSKFDTNSSALMAVVTVIKKTGKLLPDQTNELCHSAVPVATTHNYKINWQHLYNFCLPK